MTQLDLIRECVMPDSGQLHDLLLALKQRRITLWIAIHELGIGSLSRRICDLRDMGWPVRDRFIKTSKGASVKEYWLE